jgi:hypothetical protein
VNVRVLEDEGTNKVDDIVYGTNEERREIG